MCCEGFGWGFLALHEVPQFYGSHAVNDISCQEIGSFGWFLERGWILEDRVVHLGLFQVCINHAAGGLCTWWFCGRACETHEALESRRLRVFAAQGST